jgi:hypothetical protein
MDNINNGIQISGGSFNADNLAVGNQARALKELHSSEWAKEIGRETKQAASSRAKVFVSYSHKDAKWVERLRVHIKPFEQKGIIELWDDSKIPIGTKWRKELQAAIQSSTIALLIVSPDFLASDFIAEYELPKLLLRAEAEEVTVMPVIVALCSLKDSGIEVFQSINPPSMPLNEMTNSEQERTFVKLAEAISRKLTGI